MNDKTLEKINKFLELSQQDTVTPQEIEKFITMVLEFIAKSKKEFDSLSAENIQTIKDAIAYITEMHNKHMSEIQTSDKQMTDTMQKEIKSAEDIFNTKIKEAQNLIKELKSIKIVDGRDGTNGVDGINGINGKDGSPDTGEEIVTKINELPNETDYKIDWTHIKNIPNFGKNNPNGGGWRNLFQMHDVGINNPTNGQTLVYNSATQLWENGAGGSGGTQTLAQTLALGNTTGDILGNNNIILSDNSGTGNTTNSILSALSGGGYINFINQSPGFDLDQTIIYSPGKVVIGSGNETSSSLVINYANGVIGVDSLHYSTTLGNYFDVGDTGIFLSSGDIAANNGIIYGLGISSKSFVSVGITASVSGFVSFLSVGNANISLYAPNTSNSYNMYLPTAQGGAGTFLQNDGAGNLSWGTAGAGTVTSVSGTANRITVTNGTTTPVIDIAATYVGQSSITTLGTIASGAIPASLVTAGTFGTGAYTMDTKLTIPQVILTANAITASGNAATIPVTYKNNIVTNNSAGAMTITLTTSGAVNMQDVIVQVLDFSGAVQNITWVNTENSLTTVPATTNGSTTLPVTVGFKYNSATSKWRCVALS